PHNAVTFDVQFVSLWAGDNLYRAFGPGKARVLKARVPPLLLDAGEILLCTAVRFGIDERVEPGKAIADPAARGALGQIAEQHDIEHIGPDTRDHGDSAQRNLVQLAPRLIRRVAVIATAHLEVGHFEGLLVQDTDAPLRKLQQRAADVYAQAAVEQLPFGARLVLAALRRRDGTGVRKTSHAERGAGGSERKSVAHEV